MPGELAEKIAVVTGASRGLGKSIALELSRAGASVVIAARTVETGQSRLPGSIRETADQIEKEGGRAIPVQCDVTRDEDVKNLIAYVNRHFGDIDIMINNAGVTTPEPFLKLTARKWDLVMGVNLRGTFLCCKAVIPQMVERKSGHIINISSILAKDIKYSIVYGASKAAIERFTMGLAKEVRKHNVFVNAFRPDFTVTEAVTTFMKDVDTTHWQRPEMWGKYAVRMTSQNAQRLSGRILDETALKEIFGEV